MVIKDSLSRKIFVFCNTIFLIFLALTCVYPILYVLFASLSSPTALMAHEGLLLKPLKFTTEAYKMVAKNPYILSGYAVTIFTAGVGTICTVLATTVGAYFFSRRNVMHQKMFMLIIVITMYIGGGLIPTYLLYKGLGLENNLLVLIIPGLVGTGNLIILRTAFYSVPDSLEEAAMIDGAGHVTTLFKVLFPLILPTIAVIAMYCIVGHWNAWFNASIYIRDRSMFPLQLILREILLQNDTSSMEDSLFMDLGERAMISMTIQYAVIIVATAPILCIYPFVQKYFVKGTMVGAVKE